MDDVSGETNVHPPRLPAISSNPIIAALQRWLQRRGNLHATVLTDSKSTPEEVKRLIDEKVFDDEVICELATLMIEALLDGNQGFTNTVKQAIKNADSLFHRDREKALLGKCARYVWKLAEPLPSSEEIKKRLEIDCNKGKTFDDHQWRRLRVALHLPKRKSGPR